MAPTINDVKSTESVGSTSAGPIIEPVREVVIGDVKIADAPRHARDGAHAPRHRAAGVKVVGNYFLGSEDRVMFPRANHSGVYGIGNYIYMDDDFHPIAAYEFTTMTITIEGGATVLLDDEPSFELFMSVLGRRWDGTYRDRYTNDEDRSDYVPVIYRSREVFSNHLTHRGAGELYHPYDPR
jgi:hypothetical protein